ncbi:MAG: aspartate--ammonia ligase [Sphingobacteriaceae bacterium]
MNFQKMLKTEVAITLVKETLSKQLISQLNLIPVSSPIVVLDGTGINDDLNGIERPVAFPVKSLGEQRAVVVHSLAKWKRLRLKQLEVDLNSGILTDMRALRPDEDYTHMHSIYVDQWDWEKHIETKQRNLAYLKSTVHSIYEALKYTEKVVEQNYPTLNAILPEEITFMSSEELLNLYPDLSPKGRENAITKKRGAVFIYGIGGELSNGEPHDGRAPDYDDWSSVNETGSNGLNGDILVWHPILQCAFELSSMGIRVDKTALLYQLELRNSSHKAKLSFHKMLLEESLPESIGGGIGQSRVCMFMLKKSHIGEVQVSIWSEEERQRLADIGVELL